MAPPKPQDISSIANLYTAQQNRLETVQRLAMKAILGFVRTTLTAAMQIETGIMPLQLRLQEKVLKTLTRIQTLPKEHPLHEWNEKAKNNRNKTTIFLSNLENLVKHFLQIATTPSEAIVPFIRPLWWIPTIATHIEPTKEDGKAFHDKTTQELTTAYIYTDGSGIDRQIGAAAVNIQDGTTTH
jgi:ribonuclease HI